MAKTTRRQFLDSTLAVAVAGAATLAPGVVRAATPTPAAPAGAPAAATTPGAGVMLAAAPAGPRVIPPPTNMNGAERGVTRSSNQSELAFNLPGVVSKVAVKAGDPVAVGQLIAQQDDREEQVAYRTQASAVETAKLQIRAAEADLKQKRVTLARIEKLYADLVARGESNSELDEARVAVEIGDIAVQYRGGELAKEKLTLENFSVKAALRKMVSPMDGVVARVDAHAGEGTDLAKPVGILIVQNDPLWVEANVLSAKTVNLRKGQTLQVCYQDGGEWMPAKIIYLADVANAMANVRMIRLEMANTLKREAGLQVFVKFPDAGGAPAGGGAPAAQADPAARADNR